MSQVVQDEGRERLTRIVAGTSLVASLVYITWRWGWTLGGGNLWFSLPLVVAETYGVLAAALLTFTAWRLRRRVVPPAAPGRSVDVFVTTAGEPIAIVRKTALAARQIHYPHTTWLLDDGHRDEVRTVAEELGIRYLRRDDRTDGKAGNLNHALAHSSGEFLLQLDADHVPLPHIVDRLLGFLADDRVAFVQSPQDFYNTDAFADLAAGRGRQLWGDQQLFFNILQPGKDREDAAMCVGSCALLRRAALQQVGGFARHTAVMGTETSLLLHAAGWHSAYLNEPLAFGLAPATAHAYQVQQLHRAQGAMHTLRRLPPLAQAGLSPAQRVMYFDTLITPLGGLQRLILYLAPIVFLATGAFPIRASIGTFAAFFLPAMLLRAASFRLLTRGQGSLLLAERYWMAKFFTHVIAVRAFLTAHRLRYRARADEGGSVPLRTVAPQLALIGLTAAALGWAIYARSIGYGTAVPGWGSLALYAAVLLALWHAGLAGHVVQLSLAGRHRRAEHRFAESLAVALRVIREDGKLASTDIAMTEDLTATGLALRGMYAIPTGARVEMDLPLSGGEVRVRGRVVRNTTIETELGKVHLAGVEFDATTREVRDAIELHCAQHAMPLEQQRHRQAAALAGPLRRLRDLRGERRVEIGMPARVVSGSDAEAEDLGVGLLEDVSPRGGRVVLDHPVAEGTELTLHIPGSATRVSGRVVFVHALRTAVGMRFVAGFETEAPLTAGGAPAAEAAWYAAIVQLGARYSQAALTSSRSAVDALSRTSRTTAAKVAEGSRVAADRLAASSRTAADRLAASSRTAADRLAASSRVALETVARESKLAGEKLAAVSRRVATPPRSADATLSARDDVEYIPLEPLAPAALAAIAARSTQPAAPEAVPSPAPSQPVEAGLPPAVEAELAAEAPAMEPAAAPAEAVEPDRVVEMEITGDFNFPFELSVGATVLIAEEGRVTADISTVHAIVLGQYTGTLRATRSIRVGPSARVDGLLEAPELEIADGALINGLVAGDLDTALDDESLADSSTETGRPVEEAAAPEPVAEPAPAAPVAPLPPPDAPPVDEEEIFVASPIFVEGVSRR